MSKLVTIYGGSGFVGRYVARRMARLGWRVRVAVRRPDEAGFVRPYGAVGQVEPILCNIRDDASVAAAMTGADAVINCVGILVREGRNSFPAVQIEGAERVARLSAAAGVARIVHISAIGANGDSLAAYARSKWDGEQAVLKHRPDAVILRPSVIFGVEDQFLNKFATMTRFGPVLPLVGGNTRFQPVWVDDVAQAAVKAAVGEAAPGTYELGGPEVMTLRQAIRQMLNTIQRQRLVVNLPFWVGGLMGNVLDAVQFLTGGLLTNRILTREQAYLLKSDNVVSPDARGFADLGITPTAVEAVAPDYLWRFRPSGQYADIKESARQLRSH
ncbi:complex I NDUFA9 subunit family protein [Paracoccus sp. p4-l81]|uniref:complex I NDUFA9 subunit family protein n=1 Tax=Paracoccus sp. p4-l81 TaxID=3342806 RepID=UPI0035B9FE2C